MAAREVSRLQRKALAYTVHIKETHCMSLIDTFLVVLAAISFSKWLDSPNRKEEFWDTFKSYGLITLLFSPFVIGYLLLFG
jgi:ABC-type molybdate transport system permease subunit